MPTLRLLTRDAHTLYLRAAAAVRRIGPAHNLYAGFLGERRLLLGLD